MGGPVSCSVYECSFVLINEVNGVSKCFMFRSHSKILNLEISGAQQNPQVKGKKVWPSCLWKIFRDSDALHVVVQRGSGGLERAPEVGFEQTTP